MKKIISLCLCLFMLLSVLSGCNSKSDSESSESTSENSTQNATAVEADFSKTDADMFTERDLDASYDETNAVKIELTGNSATSTSDSVKISDSTITITQEATYIVTGTLKDGMIIVDAPDTAKPQIVLNQANITSSTSAPIYVKQANKVFVTLVGENTLANGGTFTAIDDNNIDSVIFSKQDLTLNGSGSLNITSPVGHGIVGKDDLVFTGGTYSIISLITETIIVDVEQLFSEKKFNASVINGDYEKFVQNLFFDMAERNNKYKDSKMDISSLDEYDERVYIFVGFKKMYEQLSADAKEKLNILIEKAESFYKLHFVIVESLNQFNTYSYDAWYKRQITGAEGLWVGDGVADQYMLKINKVTSDLYDENGNEYGYVFVRNKPALVKLLSQKSEEEVE